MNSSSKSIVNLALATSLALVSVTGWSAEEAKATKKKSAKNAVASLHAGTASSEIGAKPAAFRSPFDQVGGGTGGIIGGTEGTGSEDPGTQTGTGTGGTENPGATGSTDPNQQTGTGTDGTENPGATGSTDPNQQIGDGTGGQILPPTPEGSPS